jgi:hypothetical protein
LETYDTTYLQDKPIQDTSDWKLRVHSDLESYPTIDEDDPNRPFIAGINVNDDDDQISKKIFRDLNVFARSIWPI